MEPQQAKQDDLSTGVPLPPVANPEPFSITSGAEANSQTSAQSTMNADALLAAGSQGLVALTGFATSFMQSVAQSASADNAAAGGSDGGLPGAPPPARISSREAFKKRLMKEAKLLVVRPLRECYSKPQSRMEWLGRVRSNFVQFFLTYSLIYVFVMLWVMLTSPLFLFEVALVAFLWVYAFVVRDPDQVVAIGSYQFGRREKYLVLIPVTAVIAVFGGLVGYITYAIFLGSIVTVGHASLRNKIVEDPLEQMQNEAEQTPFV